MDNYDKLLGRIIRASGLEKEELERQIEAKKSKLSGLISKEGAAQIVAAELGVNFENEKLKLSELVQGMRRVNTIVKVMNISPVREFNKNGREGKVASLQIGDETNNTRLVLWDTNHIKLVEEEKIKVGDVIEIEGGGVRNDEIHLSAFGRIKVSKEKIDKVVTEKKFESSYLKNVQSGQALKTRAVIVGSFEPKYFEVSPESGKKFTEADKNNGLQPQKRALLNITLDDGTETIRSVLFGDQIKELGLTEEQIFSLDEFNKAKPELMGEELIFTGNIRMNSFSNTNEFSINKVDKVDPQMLIKELEAKN